MAMQSLGHIMAWPGVVGFQSGLPDITTDHTLDAAAEYSATVIPAREAMVISHVGWRTMTVAGAPTVDTRIETVDSSGNPTGTLWATNTNIVSGALSSNTWTLHALTASATIAAGEVFAVVVLYQTGTSATTARTTHTPNADAPYSVTNVSGAAVKTQTNAGKALALGSSTTAFYSMPGLVPFSSQFNANFTSGRRGLRFKTPFKCRCVGMKWHASNQVGDFTITIYNDAGTEQSSSSTAYEGNHMAAGSIPPRYAFFDNPVTLSADTWYRAVIEVTSGQCQLGGIVMPSASYASAFGPASAHYTQHDGSWVDTTTDRLPNMDILIDQLDDGVSTGGGGKVIGG